MKQFVEIINIVNGNRHPTLINVSHIISVNPKGEDTNLILHNGEILLAEGNLFAELREHESSRFASLDDQYD